MDRRQFLTRSTLTAAAAALPRSVQALAAPPSLPATALTAVSYSQVQIAGPLRAQLDATLATVLALQDDALLYPFRKMEGLPAPGASLTGWYAVDGFAPGHCFGQWMSALAHQSASTGDPQARAKMDRMVALYSEALRPDGRFFAENHFPAYTYDKLLRGLMDAHTIGGNAQALHTMAGLTAAAAPYLPAKAISRDEMCAGPHDPIHYCYDESYTLPENQFLAWKLTRDPQYLATGKRLLNDPQFFTPLAEGRNALINQHAYSHMNELSSGIQAYFTLGDGKYLEAVTNGFALVQQQSYATGGWGPEEAFVDPATDRLFADMTGTHRSFETPCGSYAHLKLMRYLLTITGNPAYGDSMERVLYNTVAGALPLQADGRAFYYSDYNSSASKTYFPDRWPCCAGTLPLVASDYGVSSYFRDARGVFVNLYLPSTLRFTSSNGTKVALTQSGSYPCGSDVTLRLELSRPSTFTLRLRVPKFAANAEIRVNGQPAGVQAAPGTFAAVTREWKTGDRVDLTLPLPLATEPFNARHPGYVALLRGPICLFAVGDSAKQQAITPQQLLEAKPVAGGDEYEAQAGAAALRMKPFHAVAPDEPYSLYTKTV
jgi:DUF1680 family protein